MQFWNELEGQVLDGYPLLRLVRSEGRTAWFETEIPENGTHPATISLTESLTDVDEVTERLQAAQQIQHPNLVAISKVGYARLDRTLFVYAVMEHTDQNLSDVLREQALSTPEAHQIAEAMVGALTEIHQRGLVHGRVEPASIVAIGEQVKLRSDCLQAPGGTRAGDVAGIGATLFQSFTQRQASSADDAQINRIPAPFAEIVRNSLSSRWSLAQVAAVLKPPAVPTAGSASSERPAAAVKPPARPASSPVDVPRPTSSKAVVPPSPLPTPAPNPIPPSPRKPVRDSTPPSHPRDVPPRTVVAEEREAAGKSRSLLLYAALAIALLIILGWLIFRPKSKTPSSSAPGSGAESQTPAAIPPSAPDNPPARSRSESSLPPPTAAPNAQTTKPPAAHLSSRQVPTETGPLGPSAEAGTRVVWRVVAYTYRRPDQAQHKADDLNSAHSDLNASVFSPRGGGSYLVVVGGAMDHSHAIAMRDKARGEGLPPDTYAQNFSQ
jgi:eukaryotic-like serine/threonine-protein kinase